MLLSIVPTDSDMTPHPLLGVLFHWVGGFAAASFYVPYRAVRGWSWEVLWLVGGVFSWILAPWIFAAFGTHHLLAVLEATPRGTLALCYFFGLLWGFGGLTYGLTVRYLGIALGTAVALGLTAAFGTLIPPLVSGQFFGSLIHTTGGRVVLLGIAVALVGIAVVGKAGHDKEREQSARHLMEQDRTLPRQRDFSKGIALAIFCGVMSACFAYGLDAGGPIRHLALAQGTGTLWQGLPVLVVVLLGGFTTNAVWCLYLIIRNSSAADLTRTLDETGRTVSLQRNYQLCALGGIAWYLQFFFYTMGESQMGRYGFSSWTLHMSSIIIFATIWGLVLKEWRGASRKSIATMTVGLVTLVGATVVIGLGNYIVVHG